MTTERRQVSAVVKRLIYPAGDALASIPQGAAAFYIFGCDIGTAKGRLSHTPVVGERLVLDGSWAVSKFNGRPEFNFVHASAFVPVDERALLKYVCTMTPGFGPATEERIWERWGSDWRKLDTSMSGITPRLVEAFRKTADAVRLNSEQSKAVAWLLSIGLTQNMAEAAWEKWGASTAMTVKDDPYSLAQLPHYGFAEVDRRVCPYFKVGRDDPRRVRAAIKYCLSGLTQEDTIVRWADLSARITSVIDADQGVVARTCAAMFRDGSLRPFADTASLSAEADAQAETAIHDFAMLPQGEGRAIAPRQPHGRDFNLDETQLSAVAFAVNSRFAIINGPAGSGKTTLIKSICDTLGGEAVSLCSFAGKAAARMREATSHAASTIHSMLGWQGETGGFAARSLQGRTVVLDEASMVPSWLMYEIVKRSPDRLILVGDAAQLPPVGAGRPFHDLIDLCGDKVRTLSRCYRNREAVFEAAAAIRAGILPPPSIRSEGEAYDAVSRPDPKAAHEFVLDEVRSGRVDFAHDLVLTCGNGANGELCAVNSLNRDIKGIVNPNADGSDRIAPGDRVICTKNDAELDVWNGTTGRCLTIDAGRAMWVELDTPNCKGRSRVLISRKRVADWKLAYCLTVHKAQGSQYRRVLFAIQRHDAATLLDRPMVYTAVTRARRECVVVGDLGAYARAVSFARPRRTVLQEIFKAKR